MNEIFNFLSQNPIYVALAVLLIVVGAFSLLKKLLKTTIVVGIVFFAYCFYLHSEGKALPTTADAERVLQQGKQMGDKLQKQAKQAATEAEQAAKEAKAAAQQASVKLDDAKSQLGAK